jgi:single-stranded DNA-binding protein
MSTMNNNVQLIGHLGSNPEVKTLESGKKVARLSLATNAYMQMVCVKLLHSGTHLQPGAAMPS